MKVKFFEGEDGKRLKKTIIITFSIIAVISGLLIYKQKNTQ